MLKMNDICYINDLDKLKALSDPLRVNIITTLGTEKKNSQQLAKALGINRTKIHYHLNILEEMGFIETVDTDSVNGIVQKYYLPTALAFVPSPNIFQELFCKDSIDLYVADEQIKDFLLDYQELKEKYSVNKSQNTKRVILNISKL